MKEQKYTVVRLEEPLLSTVRQIKRDTGKSIKRIVAEAIQAGLSVKNFN
jgi:predicted DNA-binding ribbon-helix-helix protein